MSTVQSDPVEVTVKHIEDGPDGPAWYGWESEYPEEGYWFISVEEPTLEDLKRIHPDYVFKAADQS